MRSPDVTPVIIAANNEERHLARALDRLPGGVVAPLVVANGSTDRTADIARSFGVETIELEEPGKLPAQQEAVDRLRHQGHQPHDPLLFMDADSYPVFPRAWTRIMSRRHNDAPENPQFTSGLTGFTDGNVVVNTLRTARRFQRAADVMLRHPNSLSTVFGINMGVTFGTDEVRQKFLEMPHIWPGEDRATAQLILDAGGSLHQSINPRSLVLASARYNVPLLERLKYGKQYVSEHHESDYAARRAPTATHRFDQNSATVVPLGEQVPVAS